MTDIAELKLNGSVIYPESHIDAVLGQRTYISKEMIPWIGVWGQADITGDTASSARNGALIPFGDMLGVGSPIVEEITPLQVTDGKLTVTRDCKIYGELHFYSHLQNETETWVYFDLYVNGEQIGTIAAYGDTESYWRNDLTGMFYQEFKANDVVHIQMSTNHDKGFLGLGMVSAIFQEVYTEGEEKE
ncbi:hypothetical protein [Enterococcus faecium]|uniref:hypothetical protein n=1 Tax=Enterococcus faecium TaxID=1352 RepID=UPI000BF09139|nr:hypothetical protein [Enterococcus faecium]PEH49572.1 hypothetical protein CRM75_01290 [Enterococcus faecium]